jgi:ABC-2 type transport system permease protein
MKGKQKYYKFILYLVVLVLINLVSNTLFFRVDLTSNNLYSLSDASIEAVSTLKEPLTVNVFFTKNLPAPFNNIERYLHDLLAEYEAYSKNNLSYRFYNVSGGEEEIAGEEVEENRKLAHSYGIYPGNVQKVEQDEVKMQRAYMGMVLIHGDVMEKIPTIETTEGLEYKITSAIQKMNNKISALVALPEKIKVKLVLSSSISQIAPFIKLKGLEGLKNGIREVVDKLGSRTYGQLQFVTIDPSMGEGTPEELRPFERYGLQWPEINAPNGGVIPAGKGQVVLGMSYRDKSVELNLLNRKLALTERGVEEQYVIVDTKQIETFINDNIDNLIDINEDVGYLSSHGTEKLTKDLPRQYPMIQPQSQEETLDQFNEIISGQYTVKKITLEEDSIPESIDTLIIAGPKENFSDWELFQLDQFLMKGKSLAIFMDAFREIQSQQNQGFQQPVYLPLNTGLEKLLNHYGLSVKKSYLLDENCYINRDRSGNEMPIYFVPIIENENINHNLKFLENIKRMVAIKVSPLEADKEKIEKSGLKLTEMFASSSKSWEMSGRINLLPFMIRPPEDEKQKASKPLAYLLEGEFPSYFADKPVPEKPKKDEAKEEENSEKKDAESGKDKAKETPVVTDAPVKRETGTITKGKPGKIFLIASSEMLKDNVLAAQRGGPNPNIDFLLNTLDYLNDREDIAVMRSKIQRFNPLKQNISPFARWFSKFINIAGLPALFILFGIILWVRRVSRKKQIQAMFSK